MPKNTPQREKTVREEGTYASHGDDPTLAGYLSSLFLVVSVPGFIAAAYGGHWIGLYAYSAIVPVFAGLLMASLAVAFALMHWLTGQ
ncbi:hypothetical protein [Halorussus pelagicus]|uniref:hypothetical protein n=1 Tax=Halorussus pelagicus TaxID=2505977 RepID=UPI000FFB4DED|nr:hypothetical protein [Halorussus pelagicus]